MVRRTKEDALATRHRILDSAELLFQQRGVSRTSLHEIAREARVTRGAIYWHFKDKADLFDAMMERAKMPFEAAMAGSRATYQGDPDDPLAIIEHGLIAALRVTASDPQMRRVFEIATHKVEYVDELLAVRDRRLADRKACLAEIERELKTATRRGLARPKVPAHSVALGLHAVVEGLIQTWMLDPKAFDLLRVGKHVLGSYLAGLRTAPPASAARIPRTSRHPASASMG